MVAPSSTLSSSATPTQKILSQQPSSSVAATPTIRKSFERDGLQPPGVANGVRGPSNASRGAFGPSPAPGSFSVDMRSQLTASRAASRADVAASMNLERLEEDEGQSTERMLTTLRDALAREMKIREGSENMLEALLAKKAKQTKEQRAKVEQELSASNLRIKDLKNQIAELQKQAIPTTPPRSRMQGLFQPSGLRSPASISRSAAESDHDEPTESPSFALAEILQALEVEGLTPDYYVTHANNLVDLFKRYPTLKYDLVWSIFGLRMQVMLLSESREVVAAGYRMTRHAISDVSSLQKIRSMNTDYMVTLSLVKDRKADVEREQALKFVRAFLDVKDGVRQISRSVIRTIAAVADYEEDRLRRICIETLAEILIRDPQLLISCGGMKPLTDALCEGTYDASESLVSVFLYLLDGPERRRYLRPGYELEVLFTPFTDPSYALERVLKQNAKAIACALKSWPGIMALSMYNFRAIRSLLASLELPFPATRETIIDLLFGILRIKPPSWSSSFLAGRRLTTYGRVANLKSPLAKPTAATTTTTIEDDMEEKSLVDHYTALLLAVLIASGMVPSLLRVTKDTDNPTLKRKTTLLIGEVLKLSSKLLPTSWSSELQLLPELFAAASQFGHDDRFVATGTVYQIDSVNRTLHRSAPTTTTLTKISPNPSSDNLTRFDDQLKAVSNTSLDETTFRQMLLDTQVLSSTNYLKWNWDVILRTIEGPLLNGKRLDEAIKASKFIKRIVSFYRPFKFKFADVSNSRPNQKYVKVGCALMRTLLQTPEGIKYLSDSKLLRQIAECLAQCDPTSGLTAQSPMFSQLRLSETLCCGYFAMIGTLTSDIRGLQMLDRWRMINMMYHIIELTNRPDLVKLLLSHFDYSVNGHPRIILSKALTAGTKEIRIHSTNVLRKYSGRSKSKNQLGPTVGDTKWAIQLLVNQLYDPEVEVCATAIKILEEACSRKEYLEYIVECRPALDHLGEIGAPLLLRFLSTSIGYHYLDGLDYISNEMDDWFLGRNDAYVGMIEAVLAKAFIETPEDASNRFSVDEEFLDLDKADNDARVPRHFYRELARTDEGCKLLRDKGHFDDFATTIRDYGMQTEDLELILKVKGCLWAVGNVGSMELGAPFLEDSDVVENIVKISECHEIMSLRGTAFFVLGLISRSIHGMEILSEFGWDSNTGIMGESMGLCIPNNLQRFLSYVPWKYEKVNDRLLSDEDAAIMAEAKVDEDETYQRILQLTIDLGNTVLVKRSFTELMQLKQKKPAAFKDARLFRKAMTLLESHHYRLNIRRLFIDLFDKNIMRQIVLDEESTDEEGVQSDAPSDDKTERQRSVSDPSGALTSSAF